MEKRDRLERLKDIEWFLNALPKWAVDPSKYRKTHQTTILNNLSIARSQLKTLIEDAEKAPETCEVCGKRETDVPFIHVEANVDGYRSKHYVCSDECLQQVEDVIGEEAEQKSESEEK